MPVTIAAAQSRITPDIATNGMHIRELIVQAAANGARLVHFPEGALSGYIKTEITIWDQVDWALLQQELVQIKACCAEHNIYAAIGTAHRSDDERRPFNSLLIISDQGIEIDRYDKRYLSHTEITDWYSPGANPTTFEVDGYRFGCTICIEMAFPELYAEYEALAVDCILFASYGFGAIGDVLVQAHAATNCVWLSASIPAQRRAEGAAGIIGPDGKWSDRCNAEVGLAIIELDRGNSSYDIPLNKARPWRKAARQGDIYRVGRKNTDRQRWRT